MEIIEIKKGYIVACVISRDYGKPRPAVVVQSNLYKNHPSITVCPLTTDLIDAPAFRLLLTPTKLNGLNSTRVSYSQSCCIADKDWVTGILITLILD
ncbi:MAG: type II toxin-antitoxin system PemK/MazF family toxin [Rickettsia endosymbiont of Sceptobius lativentris]|nr:type II toxin-antitoxin system PemK/MazF family toxin [Rickettsia endosymbiont of Sceptobius lativentris]